MPWEKGTARIAENPGITVASALRKIKEKVETLREKAKEDFMVIQITSKKDGTLKDLERVKRV